MWCSAPPKPKSDAVVEHALALHARADAGLDQQVARPLLDQAGADAALDIVAAAVLQDDRTRCPRDAEDATASAPPVRADDADLRPHSALALIVRAHCNSARHAEQRRRSGIALHFSDRFAARPSAPRRSTFAYP